MTGPDKVKFVGSKVEISQVHGNLAQQVVVITVDRLTLILHRYAERLTRQRGWVAPAGVLLTIIATLATTTFQNWVLPATTWSAIFLVVAFIAFVRLIWALWCLRRAETVEQLVERIKRQDE